MMPTLSKFLPAFFPSSLSHPPLNVFRFLSFSVSSLIGILLTVIACLNCITVPFDTLRMPPQLFTFFTALVGTIASFLCICFEDSYYTPIVLAETIIISSLATLSLIAAILQSTANIVALCSPSLDYPRWNACNAHSLTTGIAWTIFTFFLIHLIVLSYNIYRRPYHVSLRQIFKVPTRQLWNASAWLQARRRSAPTFAFGLTSSQMAWQMKPLPPLQVHLQLPLPTACSPHFPTIELEFDNIDLETGTGSGSNFVTFQLDTGKGEGKDTEEIIPPRPYRWSAARSFFVDAPAPPPYGVGRADGFGERVNRI